MTFETVRVRQIDIRDSQRDDGGCERRALAVIWTCWSPSGIWIVEGRNCGT